jgi:hypothetical protein
VIYNICTWIQRPPPQKIIILWSKCATAPPKIIHFTVLYCNHPPPLELLYKYSRCRRGWGWGWGSGCRGRNRRSRGCGVRERWEGFLTTHRSHCSKTSISATAPKLPHLGEKIYEPPRHRRPHQKTIIRGR